MRVHQLSSPVESLIFQSYRTWGSVFQPPNTCCFKAFFKGVQISPKQRCLDHFGRLGNSWKNLPFFGPKKTGRFLAPRNIQFWCLFLGDFGPQKLDQIWEVTNLHHETTHGEKRVKVFWKTAVCWCLWSAKMFLGKKWLFQDMNCWS